MVTYQKFSKKNHNFYFPITPLQFENILILILAILKLPASYGNVMDARWFSS